ncbi:deoxyguanosinetriphosphate triphosphohydrolase [Acidaminobacter sp. JC074]|uniref:deoxyguanosinetriphosphate triphosphohydrolase n=1 Tax=Acidaminobacter sp. JC074 TaxID=2530199 RepID=UPI001F0E9012|nr:deoxyguanosinetriphosphate triphosphohydrolase [Acidaminobacter sp. JC074]MCH4887703.1 deoxyguanosinetriphosphate triphosphohydrolase [Acidaminobacter sp. JC074]
MNLRERAEAFELVHLSEHACLSTQSKGRSIEEEQCDVRTVFQRDRDRITHSKAFRRLMHKTQVFLSPEGDHYRTRLTHTLEVSQISRTIARALSLNEDLTEAIALGHDLGHTPFGHCGEMALNDIHKYGFRHNVQSLRVVDIIEKRGQREGLNLTDEVRDGILNHSGPNVPYTLEGQIVRLSDRIAYINHDIDDAIRAGVMTLDQIPSAYIEAFGDTSSKRINSMIMNVIENSTDKHEIQMSPDVYELMLRLRNFMFDNVYLNEIAKGEEKKAKVIVKTLYQYLIDNPQYLKEEYDRCSSGDEFIVCVKDYIAGMSDRYIINKYSEIFIPKFWR